MTWRVRHGCASLAAMRRLAVALLVVFASGCGGSNHPSAEQTNALLTDVRVAATSVTFEFRSKPQAVRSGYQPKSRIAESGSGAPVPLKGTAFFVIRFFPAASADIQGEQVIPTYTGPRRLSGPGPVLETAKTSDFEAELAWAIGVERRLPAHVSRDGSTVTVTFG
jgi:hypothetical protein